MAQSDEIKPRAFNFLVDPAGQGCNFSDPAPEGRYSMPTNEGSVELAGVDLAGQNHVCAFFNTMDEKHRVLRSFYQGGFDQGEKAAHILDSGNRKGYLKRLTDTGINVQELMGTSQLEVLPWTDMYVRDHRFDQDAMLASLENLIQSGAASGYTRTRLVGHHMDWLYLDKPALNNGSPQDFVKVFKYR